MGNKSQRITSTDFNQKDWQVADREGSNQAKGMNIFKNVRSGQLIDEYQMFWPTQQDFTFYLDSYNWRKQQYHIVQSRYIIQEHKQQFCSKSFCAKVYIQHIPTRLSDVTDIPYPDNLYVALATLQGYQKLYQNLHYFFITQDQICVDKEGVVKVWVNSDLSKNYPEIEHFADTQHKDQANMVDELMNIVWENTDEESEPTSFKQFFIKKKAKKCIGFDQAKVIVNQYAKSNSSQIPQKFVSILQMREQTDQYQQDTRNEEAQQQEFQGNQNPMGIHSSQINNYMNNLPSPSPYQQYYPSAPSAYDSSNNISSNSYVIQNQLAYYQPIQYPVRRQIIASPINHIFMPKHMGDHRGPIISIPPVKGATFLRNSTVVNSFAFINNTNQGSRLQRPMLQRQVPQQVFETSPEKQSDQQQYEMDEFELNQQQQQANSMIKTKTLKLYSQQQRFSQQPNTQQAQAYQQGMLPSYIQNKSQSPINRSLQLITKTQKTVGQQQRANKSHINQNLSQPMSINHPDTAFNSRHSYQGNLLKRDQDQDFKYYTMDKQMDLDQEIARDLRKFIQMQG